VGGTLNDATITIRPPNTEASCATWKNDVLRDVCEMRHDASVLPRWHLRLRNTGAGVCIWKNGVLRDVCEMDHDASVLPCDRNL